MATELTALAILVGALASAGYLAHRLHLTPALGYLSVGMVAALFPQVQRSETLLGWANEVGILILLFAIGLELDLKRLRQALQSTAFTLPFDIAVPAFAVAALFRLLGWSATEAVTIGLVVGLSSTIFGERMTSTPSTPPATRRRVIGILLAEDVAAGALLAIIAVLGGAAGGWTAPVLTLVKLLFYFLLLAAGALLVVPRMLDAIARTHLHELVVLAGLASVVAFGAIGYLAGSAELGALLAGVAAAEAGSRFVVRNDLRTFRAVAIALVFFATGTHVAIVAVIQNFLPSLALAVAFLVGKTLVHVPASLGQGQNLRGALYTAFALGTIGEFSIIMVAAAERSGVAHPLLSTTVVGALLILLLAASVLHTVVPAIVKGAGRLPSRVRKPAHWMIEGLRRGRDKSPSDPGRRRKAMRVLVSNILLLLAWALVVATLGPRVVAALPFDLNFSGRIVLVGLGLAVAAPLAAGAYRSYRELVWLLVGLRPGERAGAGRARVRVVDAWITASTVLMLVPVVLAVPAALPVLLGSLLFAVIVATLAWRQLSSFHHALESSVTRVLGDDEMAGQLLDRTMSRYPWGVRFSAVPVASSSPVAGSTIQESGITRLTGALVAVIQRRQREIVSPPNTERLLPGDTVVLMGDVHQLSRAEALVVAHGEALRMTAHSQYAQVQEVTVDEDSPFVGRTLADLALRERAGALVVGVWAANGQHPRQFASELMLGVGDRLIVLGTPLQIERARLHVQGLLDPPQVDKP